MELRRTLTSARSSLSDRQGTISFSDHSGACGTTKNENLKDHAIKNRNTDISTNCAPCTAGAWHRHQNASLPCPSSTLPPSKGTVPNRIVLFFAKHNRPYD